MNFANFKFLTFIPNLRLKLTHNIENSSPRGGGGYSVERWVRGCAAQIGCIFSPTGFSMTPFYFKTRF